MQIDIEVTEILSRVVTVNADSVDDAIDIVRDMYRKEEIVLDYADFIGKATIEECDLDC